MEGLAHLGSEDGLEEESQPTPRLSPGAEAVFVSWSPGHLLGPRSAAVPHRSPQHE